MLFWVQNSIEKISNKTCPSFWSISHQWFRLNTEHKRTGRSTAGACKPRLPRWSQVLFEVAHGICSDVDWFYPKHSKQLVYSYLHVPPKLQKCRQIDQTFIEMAVLFAWAFWRENWGNHCSGKDLCEFYHISAKRNQMLGLVWGRVVRCWVERHLSIVAVPLGTAGSKKSIPNSGRVTEGINTWFKKRCSTKCLWQLNYQKTTLRNINDGKKNKPMTCSTFDRYCSRQILGFATLRCLEKVPTKIIPNGGCYNYVMVICHGRIQKKTQKTTNPRNPRILHVFSSKKTSWIQKMPIFSEKNPWGPKQTVPACGWSWGTKLAMGRMKPNITWNLRAFVGESMMISIHGSNHTTKIEGPPKVY